MYLTARNLHGLGEGHVVILPTLAPGTVVEQVIQTPTTSARSTVEIDISGSQNKAIDRVPWPHPFFRSFMTAPKAQPGPFYQGFNFSDPALVKMGYFKNVGPDTDVDIAEYLYNNQDAVNTHFSTCVQEMIAAEQEKEKKAKEEAKKRGIITTIVGVVAGIVTLGAALPVVIAATAAQLAMTGWQCYAVKHATADQLKNVEFLLKFLNVSPLDFDKFRTWITNLVQSPPEVPPTPAGVTINSTYTVFKNGDFLLQNNDAATAMAIAFPRTVVGDRLTVKDETSQSVFRVYLRSRDGLMGVPIDQAHLVQSMSQAQAVQMANGVPASTAASSSGFGMSALLLAAGAAIWMVKK